MRIVKCSWSSISVSQEATVFIRGLVKRAHSLRKRAYQLCKAAILRSYEREGGNLCIEQADIQELFRFATRVIGATDLWADKCVPRNGLEEDLIHAYYAVYHDNDFAHVSNEGLGSNWSLRESEAYVNSIEHHIKENYKSCMSSCVGSFLNIEKSDLTQVIQSIARGDAVADLIPEIHEHTRRMIPADGKPMQEGYAFYDVKASPLRYLPCMLYMCGMLEESKLHVYAVLPLVTSHIPGSMLIDTCDLLHLLPNGLLPHGTKKGQLLEKSFMPSPECGAGGKRKRSDFTDEGWTAGQIEAWEGKYAIWRCILDLNKPIFAHTCRRHPPLVYQPNDWRFNAMLTTDGYSASIYLEQRHHQEDRKVNKDAYKRPDVCKIQDELAKTDLPQIQRVVAIDPGKNNLIYAYDGGAQYFEETRTLWSKGNTFRYTRKQRQAETKTHVFRKRLELASNSRFYGVGHRSLSEWNKLMADNFSSRTPSSMKFEEYLRQALVHEEVVQDFYLEGWHRKRRFESYQLQQRSEAKMVNSFKQRMGINTETECQETLIAFGDGAQNNLKGQESMPSIGIARLLLRNHLRVALVRENYTSMRCFHCALPTANTKANVIQREAANGSRYGVWGLCKCQTCHRLWTRDFHAALNIHHLASCEVRGEPRPVYLSNIGATQTGANQPITVPDDEIFNL